MATGGDIDVAMNRALMRDHSEEDRRTLLMIQAGGVWTASSLAKAGILQDSRCPWCGWHTEDLRHLWWDCPAHEACRAEAKQKLEGVWQHMPDCLLLHGLPSEGKGDLLSHTWEPGGPVAVFPERELVGDDRLAWAAVHEYVDAQLRHHQHHSAVTDLSVRQLCLWLHGDFAACPSWEVSPCVGMAPSDVNIYTDGGLELGKLDWTASGTWGLYWPDHAVEDLPNQLADLAHVDGRDAGVLAYGQNLGPGLSSTRAEALALYAAMALPGPLHVGIDSAAVIRRGTKLLRSGRAPRRPWGLQADGDIWMHISANMRGRGRASMKLTKLKGHATVQDILDGRILPEHMRGNCMADHGATTAREAQRKELRHGLKLLSARWREAKQDIKVIQDMMVSIVNHTRGIRDQILQETRFSDTHRKSLVEITGIPELPPGAPTRRLRRLTRTLTRNGMAHWQAVLGDWLQKWEWLDQDCVDVTTYVTWLELLVAFETDTGTAVPDQSALQVGATHELRIQEGIGQLTTRFRQATLLLLKQHFTTDVMKLFMQPGTNSQKGQPRLLKVGIAGAWSHAFTMPYWHAELRAKVGTALMAQRGLQPRSEALAQGPWIVRPKALDKHKAPTWPRPQAGATVAQDTHTQNPMGDHMKNYQVQCNKCRAVMPLVDKPVAGNHMHRIKCQQCRVQMRVGGMTCCICLARVSQCKCSTTKSGARQQTLKFSILGCVAPDRNRNGCGGSSRQQQQQQQQQVAAAAVAPP